MSNPAIIQSMAQAAGNFADAAPGHRFNLYFPIWRNDWGADNTGKKDAIKQCTPIPRKVGEVLDALRTRQQAVFVAHPEGLRVEVRSTAPFATGLGNEHPVENGFAFLTPYGLPYLAGSGVKGVLRRAAEELVAEGMEGFGQPLVDALFGPQDIRKPEDARRGALDFWDVFPEPPKEALTVEIMTPHYTDYYQKGGTPNDAGQPTPIPFLAVPAGALFQFHVVCQPHYLPESLRQTWKPLLEKIFTHAFDWLGFGAKTAVGYGAMIRQGSADASCGIPMESMQAKETKTPLSQSSFAPKEEIWDNVTLTWNPGNRELGVLGKKASVKCEPGSEMVSEDVIARLKKDKSVKANVTVEPVGGNAFKIVKVESPG